MPEKSITTVYLDSDLKKIARSRKIENPNFSLSEIINSYLRDYFKISNNVFDLETKKQEISNLKKEIDNKISILKSKQNILKTSLENIKSDSVEDQKNV